MQSEQKSIRSFIGVSIKDMGLENTFALRMASYKNEERFTCIKWIPTHFLHMTLSFLGNQTPTTLTALQTLLDEPLKKSTSFPITINYCSGFPDAKSRIVAAIPDLSKTLQKLQADVEICARALEIELDERKFVPHITMGRVIKGKTLPFFQEPFIETGTISAVTFYQSELTPGGSHYSVMKRWPLDKRSIMQEGTH